MKARAEAGRLRHRWRAMEIRHLTGPLRRFPQRLRDMRFWQVQALLLAATAPHYAFEILDEGGPSKALYALSITAYIVPLLYAALAFGWEGAILTGVWAAALTSPSVWVWRHSLLHWAGELSQLAIILPVGVLMAWRVEREAKLRLRAEDTSARLQLLNEVGDILSHTLDVEQQLPEVVRRLQSGLSLESVSLRLEREADGSDSVLIETPQVAAVVDEPPTQVEPALPGSSPDARTLEVPLFGETGRLGSLRATAAGENLTEAQAELITRVGQQIRVAVENARLYRQRQESLQSYARQVTQAQEDERLRIARELHDETAQELVHLSRKLEELKGRVAQDQVEDIDGLLAMTRGTIQAVRRYSRDLRPSVLDDLGLRAAIEMVVEETSTRLSKDARLRVTGNERRLDGPLELTLFRIAQEALRNVVKHAGATAATVALDFGGAEITLTVRDDGRGFVAGKNVADLIQAGKLGVIGMKERAELVGGSFGLESRPGGGTLISVRVPAAGRAPA